MREREREREQIKRHRRDRQTNTDGIERQREEREGRLSMLTSNDQCCRESDGSLLVPMSQCYCR